MTVILSQSIAIATRTLPTIATSEFPLWITAASPSFKFAQDRDCGIEDKLVTWLERKHGACAL